MRKFTVLMLPKDESTKAPYVLEIDAEDRTEAYGIAASFNDQDFTATDLQEDED